MRIQIATSTCVAAAYKNIVSILFVIRLSNMLPQGAVMLVAGGPTHTMVTNGRQRDRGACRGSHDGVAVAGVSLAFTFGPYKKAEIDINISGMYKYVYVMLLILYVL